MIALGVTYVFVTPPMRVPDEHLHFFRAAAIANGHLIPNGGGKPDASPIPQGLKTLVWVMSWVDKDGKFNKPQFQTAIRIPLEPVKQPVVEFPAWYTPMPYLPQTFALVVARVANIRPLIAFYGGRLANLAVAITLIALAMRVAPSYRNIVAATAMLPMALYEFASFSADALTLAAAILFTALLVEHGSVRASAAVGFVLGVCKPAYFLLAFLARRARLIVIATMAVATALAFAYAHMASYQQRGGIPIDAVSQLRCVIHDPLHFVGIMARDLMLHAAYYLEGMIGRLGLNEFSLPVPVVIIEVLTLIAAAISSTRIVPVRDRVLALLVVVGTGVGVVLSQYMIWSIVCGDAIEGVQGRYFLPVLPAGLLAISATRLKLDARVICGIALVCNAFAFVALVRRYWI